MSIVFLGDIMLGRHVSPYIEEHGIQSLFDPLESLFNNNYVIANLESPLSNCRNPLLGKSPILYGSIDLAEQLKEIGFTGFSLANNHIFDCSAEGLLETVEALEAADLLYTGAGTDSATAIRPIILEVKGKSIGIVSFSYLNPADPAKPGVAYLYGDMVKECITKVKKKVDFLVAMPHSGIELLQYPLPRDQKVYRNMIEWGADIVIGSHTHCIQAMEIYRGKNIFYSIGDCVFDHHHPDVWKRFWKKGGNTEKFGIRATSDLPRRSIAITIDSTDTEIEISYQPLIMDKPPGSQLMDLSAKNDWLPSFEELSHNLALDPDVETKRYEIEKQLLASLS